MTIPNLSHFIKVPWQHHPSSTSFSAEGHVSSYFFQNAKTIRLGVPQPSSSYMHTYFLNNHPTLELVSEDISAHIDELVHLLLDLVCLPYQHLIVESSHGPPLPHLFSVLA